MPVINPFVIDKKYQLIVTVDQCDSLAPCDTGK